MLIGLAAGTLPSKRTLPRTVAALVFGGGPPALTAHGAEIHTARLRAKIETNIFRFITAPQFQNFTNFQRHCPGSHGVIAPETGCQAKRGISPRTGRALGVAAHHCG